MKDTLTGKDLGLTAVRGRLLPVKIIAAFMRVSERWIEEKMQKGIFPVRWHCFGERFRCVDSADLDDWLKKTVREAVEIPAPLRAAKKIKNREANIV